MDTPRGAVHSLLSALAASLQRGARTPGAFAANALVRLLVALRL